MVATLVQAPARIKTAVLQVYQEVQGGTAPELLIDKASTVKPYWVERFLVNQDNGYLLWSGVSAKYHQSVIRLIRLHDGATLRTWAPNLNALAAKITHRPEAPLGAPQAIRLLHPFPLLDGGIAINTLNSLVVLNSCSDEPRLVLDGVYHHSIQQDAQGNIVVPSVSKDGWQGNSYLQKNSRDDAIAWVSPTSGNLLSVRAFSDILISNNLGVLVLGFSGQQTQNDPIHLNQITPALTDGDYWKKGDLLISARHLSTLFLYRPSTNKIIWHKTGPWLNQHSAAFVGSHQISVFSNNVFGSISAVDAFLRPTDHNRVFIYDFKSDSITEPWAALLDEARPISYTEGRAQVLDDGGLFVEETNHGRLLRFTQDRLLWSMVNHHDEVHLGALNWSRYLNPIEAHPLLNALEKCPSP